MTYRLPSLNALRAFEASARHLSFKSAANELNVTPGALSQHVKSLEEALGVHLFQRLNKQLILTPQGESYLPSIHRAFKQISEATERVTPSRLLKVLVVGVQSSLASRWLLPKLEIFRKLHPNVDVRISTSVDITDLLEGRIQLLIRHGLGYHPGLRAHQIAAEDRFPVCSPDLLQGPPPLKVPQDLQHHTLLHGESRDDWRSWLKTHNIGGVEGTRGPSFGDDNLALQAAVEGHGIALGRTLLVDRDLAAGRLVKPFALSSPNDQAYYLLCPDGVAECPEVLAFCRWLLAESRSDATRVNPSNLPAFSE